MMEQNWQIKDNWSDVTGYLKEYLMDMSVKYKLFYTTSLVSGTYREQCLPLLYFHIIWENPNAYGWSLLILQALKVWKLLWVYSR